MSDDSWNDRPIYATGDLAILLGGSPDSFTGRLLELIAKADAENRGRLKLAFPRETMAWQVWQSVSPAPTFRQMSDLMADIEGRVETPGYLAELGYGMYCGLMIDRDIWRGDMVTPWPELPQNVRDAWRCAVDAVLEKTS